MKTMAARLEALEAHAGEHQVTQKVDLSDSFEAVERRTKKLGLPPLSDEESAEVSRMVALCFGRDHA